MTKAESLNPLDPGAIIHSLDEAMHAASCLCGLHVDGATVYGTTTGPDCGPGGEAYRIATKAVQRGGATWAVPGAPYEALYTITSAK